MLFYTIASNTNQNLSNKLPHLYTESGCYTVGISFNIYIPVYTQRPNVYKYCRLHILHHHF